MCVRLRLAVIFILSMTHTYFRAKPDQFIQLLIRKRLGIARCGNPFLQIFVVDLQLV